MNAGRSRTTRWTLIALILLLGGRDDSTARADQLGIEPHANPAIDESGVAPLDCETLLDSFENDLRFVTRERSIQTRGFMLSLVDEGYSTLEQDVVMDRAGVTDPGDTGYFPTWSFLDLASIREFALLPNGDTGNVASQQRKLVEAIEQGATLSAFEALLDSTGVDVRSTWLSFFPFRLNLAIVAVANARPAILRLLIERGVDPTHESLSALDAIADALNRDVFSLPEPQLSVALSDIVSQLVSVGDRAYRPSAVTTIQRALPGVGEIPLHADVERVAMKPRVIEASQALASLDAEWNGRIDIGTRIESECIEKATDAESMEAGHSLAVKMQFEEAFERQQQQFLERFRRQSERLGEMFFVPREDLVAAVSGLEPLLEASRENRWKELVELMDTTNPIAGHMASGFLYRALEEGAPMDVIEALIEHNHGSLPPDAILKLVSSGADGSVDMARHLEQRHGMDVHFVDDDGRNAFVVALDGSSGRQYYDLYGVDGSLRVWPDPYTLEWVHYLADRQVKPKSYRWGLDPLDRLLRKMANLPFIGAVGVGYVRLLIDQGAPVELSHLEIVDRLFEEAPAVHRCLIECVPELSVGRRSVANARTRAASNEEECAAVREVAFAVGAGGGGATRHP